GPRASALCAGAKVGSGGKVASAEALAEQVRLRAFASSGGAQQDQAPWMRDLGGRQTGGGWTFEPGGALVLGGCHTGTCEQMIRRTARKLRKQRGCSACQRVGLGRVG